MNIEEIREKIKANFPKEARSTPEPLKFERETLNAMVSTCNRFRITKQVEEGVPTYAAWMGPKRVGGRFMNAQQAMDALELWK